MRHGHSMANSAGIIVSDPSIGTIKYGLSPEGVKQVEAAADSFPGNGETIICSSDFQRTRETSEILKRIWRTGEIIYTPNLRERFFGDFEGNNNKDYEKIWELDKSGEDLQPYSIESTGHVAERVKNFIMDLESRFEGKTIFLISHGDCLQILQAVKMNLSPKEHRSVPHLNVAEIREI